MSGDWSGTPPRGGETLATGLEARGDAAPSAAPVGRPAPEYGEYAPEGWVNPVLVEQERREREAAAREAAQAGNRGTGPARPTGTEPPGRSATGSQAQARRFGASPGDALATLLLLALGLTTVLQQVTGIGRLSSQVAQEIADRYTELTNPGALVPATVVAAIVGVFLLVGAAWWSIVRLRRAKRAFWVPLLAGAVAGIVSTAAYVVVIMQDPAFSAWMAAHTG
jgi:hypothetical protein